MTKRTFLRTIGTGLPTLKLMFKSAAAQTSAATDSSPAEAKFTPVDCSRYFTALPADAMPSLRAGGRPMRTPYGQRSFRGIPFVFAPENAKSWFWLSRKPGARDAVEIPLHIKGTFLCLAQFCDWDQNENSPADIEAFEQVGQHLADAIISYEDGVKHVRSIRRRFEVNSLSFPWGHQCFDAMPHRDYAPVKLDQPLRNAKHWGDLQSGSWYGGYGASDDGVSGTLWLCAIENPSPDRVITSLRVESRSDDSLVICALTVGHDGGNPLRRERLSVYRLTLPEGEAQQDWQVTVDLGIVARTYKLPPFEADSWVASRSIGAIGPHGFLEPNHLYVEVSAAQNATLTLRNANTGARFDFELSRLQPEHELEGQPAGARIQALDRHKVWLRGRVVDKATGRPTPVRLSFRTPEGRYVPPYGHRTEINSAWFQDYGADIMVGDSSFAYVDGTFQIELPVGESYVEISKGFEYEPIRRKLQIGAEERELNFEIVRFADLRSQNWISADTHVHFLSPTTAILEGQAEDLNLINLLAAQWGDLFTNVGDLYHTPLTSNDGEMMVWVGTENRQHLLGHLGLLGGHGDPPFPMSASGPDESYIGDPLWETLSGWADACRQREGLVVAAHFPYPTAELAADIALGKIDAVELWPTGMSEEFNTLRFLDWYRYLNCGYRLPAVSGTDKMGAWIAAGTYRVYASLGQDPFNFANWAKAVRRGNTFMTSGPLLLFQVEGRSPGEEIRMGAGGGKVQVRANVRSTVPVHRVEIVSNGRVVATREDKAGTREMHLDEVISVSSPAWLAARCASRFTSGSARIAAHTSPVYLVKPGQELFSASTAAYMLTLIEGTETWLKNLATRPNAGRYARALGVLSEARNRLHQRMHEHGAFH